MGGLDAGGRRATCGGSRRDEPAVRGARSAGRPPSPISRCCRRGRTRGLGTALDPGGGRHATGSRLLPDLPRRRRRQPGCAPTVRPPRVRRVGSTASVDVTLGRTGTGRSHSPLDDVPLDGRGRCRATAPGPDRLGRLAPGRGAPDPGRTPQWTGTWRPAGRSTCTSRRRGDRPGRTRISKWPSIGPTSSAGGGTSRRGYELYDVGDGAPASTRLRRRTRPRTPPDLALRSDRARSRCGGWTPSSKTRDPGQWVCHWLPSVRLPHGRRA